MKSYLTPYRQRVYSFLMEAMRESQETKKLMLEVKTQNELIMKEIAASKEEKKSWWKKLFS